MFRVESSRANLAPRAEFSVKYDVYDDVRFVQDDVEGIVGNIKSIQEQQVDQISIYTLNQTYYGNYKTVEQIDHTIHIYGLPWRTSTSSTLFTCIAAIYSACF